MNRMVALIALSLLMACNSANEPTDENPLTLEGKRAILAEKKQDLANLEKEIILLTEELLQIDPALKKKKKIVTTEYVTKKDFQKFIEIDGIIISDESVNVVSESPGRIIDIRVEEGDYVRKGELIARIDLESFNKQKDEVLTSLQLANDIYERRSRLWDVKVGSEVEYLRAKNNKERLEKSLDVLNHELSKANIYAPISGIIDREFKKQGELANPGMPIVQILNVKDVKVSADLPERYLKILKRGMKVDVYFPSLDRNVTGKVSLLGRRIDPSNRTLNFEIDVRNQGGILKPNLLSELKITEKNLKDTIVLPIELVQEDVKGDKYVILAKHNGKEDLATRDYIEVGDIYEGRVVINSGIKEGDEIIVEGARLVTDGEGISISNNSRINNEKGS